MSESLHEYSKKILDDLFVASATTVEAIDNIVEVTIPAFTAISGTTSTSFIFGNEQQGENVYSRDVIIEKFGFRTRTQKKHYEYIVKPMSVPSGQIFYLDYRYVAYSGTAEINLTVS